MNRLANLLSTCLGLGYTPKGGGTVASVACCLIWYFCRGRREWESAGAILATFLLLAAGVWSADRMEGESGERIITGSSSTRRLECAFTLLFVPVRWPIHDSRTDLIPVFSI